MIGNHDQIKIRQKKNENEAMVQTTWIVAHTAQARRTQFDKEKNHFSTAQRNSNEGTTNGSSGCCSTNLYHDSTAPSTSSNFFFVLPISHCEEKKNSLCSETDHDFQRWRNSRVAQKQKRFFFTQFLNSQMGQITD